MLIDSTQFIGNIAQHPEIAYAGALWSTAPNPENRPGRTEITIVNSLFRGNIARGGTRGGPGGAMWFGGSYMLIGNTSFIGNRAEGECANCWNASGGALFVADNIPTPAVIVNSTIADNYSGWGPGAVRGPQVALYNSILANNEAFNLGRNGDGQNHCRDPLAAGSNNIQFPFYNDEGFCTSNSTAADPLLGPVAGNAAMLQTGSGAIDTGDEIFCVNIPTNNVDANGVPRPVGAACDVGAFEYVNNNQPPAITRPADQTDPEGASVNLTIGTNDANGDNVTLLATGLPDGLQLDGNTITGTIAEGASERSPIAVKLST